MTELLRETERGVAIDQSFAILVYPFRHGIVGIDRGERLRELWPQWRPWWARLSADEVEAARDDSLFFLPYVRDLLFPELCHLARQRAADGPGTPEPEGERLGQLTPEDLAGIPPNAVIRLTRNGPGWDALRDLHLEYPGRRPGDEPDRPSAAEVELCWADVFLFPQGIGFLCLKVRPKGTALAVGELREILRHLRLIEPLSVGWPLVRLRGTRTAGLHFEVRFLVSYLLQGLTEKRDRIEPDLGKWLQSNLMSGIFAGAAILPGGHLYGQAFNVFGFALLDGGASDPAAGAPHSGNGAATRTPSHPLDPPALRVLYELATCTDSRRADYSPHPSYVEHLLADNLFAHWENWQALALHDNVTFLGTNATPFTRGALGHNVESDYFHLYLIALFQKYRMSVMFGEVMRRDAHLHANLQKARHLWDSFLAFQDHYWFNEVTPHRQGTELYRCYQRGLDVLSLHAQLSGRVRDLQEHFERKYERRLDRLMKFVTFIAFPTSWMISLYGKLFDPKWGGRWAGGWVWAEVFCSAGVLYGGFFLAWLIWVYLRPE